MTLVCTGKPESVCDSLYCGGLPGAPAELSRSSGGGTAGAGCL